MFNDSKFLQKISILSDESTGKTYEFEVDGADIGFEAITKERTLADYSIFQDIIGYRLVVSMSNRFLRMGNADSELKDLLNNRDNLRVYAAQIGWTSANAIPVKYTGGINTTVQRQRIVPATSIELIGSEKIDEIPSWYKITFKKPAYL